MDPVQQPQEQPIPEKKTGSHLLFLLKIGFFEISFVAICIAIILLCLNYFNVFNFGNTFPALSFLPRYIPISPTPTPSPFQYNVKKANAMLSSFQQGVILPQYLSTVADDSEALIGNANTFTRNWDVQGKNTQVHTAFTFQPQTDNDWLYLIRIQTTLSASESATISSTSATTILKKYFILPSLSTQMECIGNSCVQFDSIRSGREGVGVIYGSPATVYLCYFSNNVNNSNNPPTSCPKEALQ